MELHRVAWNVPPSFNSQAMDNDDQIWQHIVHNACT